MLRVQIRAMQSVQPKRRAGSAPTTGPPPPPWRTVSQLRVRCAGCVHSCNGDVGDTVIACQSNFSSSLCMLVLLQSWHPCPFATLPIAPRLPQPILLETHTPPRPPPHSPPRHRARSPLSIVRRAARGGVVPAGYSLLPHWLPPGAFPNGASNRASRPRHAACCPGRSHIACAACCTVHDCVHVPCDDARAVACTVRAAERAAPRPGVLALQCCGASTPQPQAPRCRCWCSCPA